MVAVHHARAGARARRPDHVQIVVLNGTPLFFSQRDGPWYPTLRLLHQYPDMMAKLRADVGAIKFVLSGANIMAPGLTSAGATIHDEVHCGAHSALHEEASALYELHRLQSLASTQAGLGPEHAAGLVRVACETCWLPTAGQPPQVKS